MTFGQFISVLQARWRVALLVLLVTVGTAVGVSLLLPSQYTATASVLVEFKPDPVSAVMYGGATSSGYLATQVDVITSDRVSYRVVNNLKLNENAQIRQQWMDDTDGKGTIEAWLTELFRKKLDVKPARESSVISVSYQAPDPGFAAAIANAFVQSYLQTTLELRVDPAKQYSAFFDRQAKDAREALERAQTKLSGFQKDKGIIASDERLDVENARLIELSSQSVLLQSLASESGSRQAQARGSSSDKLQEVLTNPLIAGLKADASRAEAQLQQLSQRLGDNNPQVIEAKANINSLRAKIESETARVTGGVGVTNTITRQREADVRASLEAQRLKVLQLKAVRDEGSVLMRDVESAQRAYELITARLTQTSLESQNTQSNINLLTAATAPYEPSSPRILLNSILSIFLGIILAIGAALILEVRDRRIRSAEDVFTILGLPLLGVLPDANARRVTRRGQPNLMQERMIGRLPAPAKGA